MIGSTDLLVRDIETAIKTLGSTPARMKLLARAKQDEFHDFKSPYVFPETELYKLAKACNLSVIANGVVNGKYDATKEESEEWRNSPEGKKTFSLLFGGK